MTLDNKARPEGKLFTRGSGRRAKPARLSEQLRVLAGAVADCARINGVDGWVDILIDVGLLAPSVPAEEDADGDDEA